MTLMAPRTQSRWTERLLQLQGAMSENLEPAESGDYRIRVFEVTEEEARKHNLYARIRGSRDRIEAGTYTAIHQGGTLWMSNTPDEQRDHMTALYKMDALGGRVLINGLGLGMVVRAALTFPHVEHIDVVELDPEIIALIGPTITDPRVTIHQGDAYEIKWPVGTRWTVAWHDIWPTITEDNLPGMSKLHRRYGGRVDWQGSWARELCEWGWQR